MRRRAAGHGIVVAVAVITGVGSCRSAPSAAVTSAAATTVGAARDTATRERSAPLVLAAGEGERRVRRVPGGAPFIIKVDARNGGSPDFLMVYEEIPPGRSIQPHRHLTSDEIIFVHRGSGAAEVGDRSAQVAAGATVYIPRGSRVTLRNTGSEPLALAIVFSRPGFEGYLRETSVAEGETLTPLSSTELAAVRQRHAEHVVYEQQP